LEDLHNSIDTAEDELVFAQEDESSSALKADDSWKILIVDDDSIVHEVTKLALADFTLEEKSLTFISAFSAEEAKHLMQLHPDTAIVFLDVVMETENAGLGLVQYIREELGNLLVRIILRTGQPGRSPENIIATRYGIDDYKTKTELTSQKLSLCVITALRAFSTLVNLVQTQQRLQLELNRQSDAAVKREENRFVERSLPPDQRERIETLGQLVTELAQTLIREPYQAGALSTMSMMTRLARIILRITEEHSTKLGISQSKLSILMYLNQAIEQCASPSALATHCSVSRAAMTGLLDGLEQEGYVERDDHPSDRRALKIKLTAKGQQFLNWISPPGSYPILELVDRLEGDERKQLTELVRDIVKIFEEKYPSNVNS
jgi:DNA-binding MarR family transcriptional regulator/response regulator of citrate/malate metabolism